MPMRKLLLGFALAAGPAGALALVPEPAYSHLVLLGTYTRDGSRGIYRVHLDGHTGALSRPELAAVTPDPTFLALNADQTCLYANCVEGRYRGGPGGAIAAFAFSAATGRLRHLDTEPTGGAFTSFVTVDPTGRWVLAPSGPGGTVTEFPVERSGALGPRVRVLTITGPPGPVAGRQGRPYPHSVWFAPDDRFFFVADLGSDRVDGYRFDAATGAIEPADPPYVGLAPGTGPRHAKFSADGRFFYVVGELAGTVTAFRYDAVRGALTPFQIVSALPAGFRGANTSSEIRIHPDGRFVYVANRGSNTIAVFARDPASGRLRRVEVVPSGGDFPRNFALSPDGAWLLCAHQKSANLTVFRVDPATGRLTLTPRTATVPDAVCVLFIN
jgi:6-phosphogluconolactonase